MRKRIGILLPRSTDYPAMGIDMLDGLKGCLREIVAVEADYMVENIGFGEDAALTYEKAEKLLLADADILVIYSNTSNAESLYPLASVFSKPFIFLDAGMQLPSAEKSPYCYHISLQGLHACKIGGKMAGEGSRKVLLASSFYDGGYFGPWAYDKGLSETGGAVCANYVSTYKENEFSIDACLGMLQSTGANSIAACFSSYLAKLFLNELAAKNKDAISIPFYCSPFMAEEQLLQECIFPGGEFYTVVPWATTLENKEQDVFTGYFLKEKNKAANIFNLLGWEAGIVVREALANGANALKGFRYCSPRGLVVIHPDTHYTYAPLYKGRITPGENGKCCLSVTDSIDMNADEHQRMMNDKPTDQISGWRNNYLCI